MSENSAIEWTDDTFNPWEGCTRVSPGCANCYAETRAARYGTVEWGKGQPRRLTSDANWKKPHRWNTEAGLAGKRRRVFCASLADVFDAEVPREWRVRLWALIAVTPWLDWLLLTKRPENIPDMLPPNWGEGWVNVQLGTTVENQDMAEKRISALLKVRAAVHFLSMEPLLGAVDLAPYLGDLPEDEDGAPYPGQIDWVIVGGESGHDARPMHPAWALSLRDQCQAAGVPFFFKQWGEWVPGEQVNDPNMREGKYPTKHSWDGGWLDCSDDWATEQDHGPLMYRVGKKRSGRNLEGREWSEYPEAR